MSARTSRNGRRRAGGRCLTHVDTEDVQVEDASCFGCHSRSGRIALSYAGWRETLEEAGAGAGAGAGSEAGAVPGAVTAAAAGAGPGERRVLADGRVLRSVPPDVHRVAGLACIDCHGAAELMGGGVAHLHEEDALDVECVTCHRPGEAPGVAAAALDGETAAIVRLRSGQPAEGRFLAGTRSGRPLSNARPAAGGGAELQGKLDGRLRRAAPPASACTALPGHARLSCSSCHARVPQCISCHTQYDARGEAHDHLTGRTVRGRWLEYDAEPLDDPPVLGVRGTGGGARIEPFAPGMILTVNGPGAGRPWVGEPPVRAEATFGPGTVFRRLFAPVEPHSTTRIGRRCRSCHNDPLALGFGRGTLTLEDGDNGAAPRWRFTPRYAPLPWDGLPADAWVGFLQTRGDPASTRRDARPFTAAEQERVLTVGACLLCHDPDEDPAQLALFVAYEASLLRRTAACWAPGLPCDVQQPSSLPGR